MNSPLPVPESAPAPRRNWTRRLVNLLVALVVVAVAAATFVFSYQGVHAIALLGGVSAQLARYYPGLFDAVLVIACVAAIMLREGRWWARLWAWLVIVVLLAAIAVADVLHAMNYSLRPRPTEGIVAAAPVAAVLLAFSLLLTMLRQSRSQPHQAARPAGRGYRRGGEQAAPATLEIPSLPLSAAEASTVEIPALAGGPQLRPPAPPIALPAAFTPPPPVAEAAVPMPAPEAAPTPAPETDTEDTAPDTAPTREDPAVAGDQEAEPPTVLTPAVPEAPAVPGPARKPKGIRYAGRAASRTTRPETDEPGKDAAPAEPAAAAEAAATAEAAPAAPDGEPAPRNAGAADDYWDAEEAGPYAGLVYPAHEEHAAPEGNGHADDKGGDTGGDKASDNGGAGDSVRDQAPARRRPAELDADAPPVATAPFAPVPRLNRVRSMPAPPSDDEE